jgi:hypothetical protein
VVAPTRARGQTPSETLIEQARTATDIRAAGKPPFCLIAHFQVLEDGVQLQGKYTLTWEGPTTWRAETSLPNFSDIRIANGNKLWISRQPAYFTPQIDVLWSMLNFPAASFPGKPNNLSKIKTKNEDGTDYRMIEATEEGHKMYQMYFDSSAPLLRQETYGGGLKRLFEDYSLFDKTEFPRTLTEVSNHKPIVRVEVQQLADARPLPTDLLVPPAGARWMPWCPQPDGLKFEGYTRPIPPLPIDVAGSGHSAYIYGVIGPDGRWHNLTVVRSGGRDFDSYFLNMLSAQRYSPAMCPNGPMYVERSLEFTPPPQP